MYGDKREKDFVQEEQRRVLLRKSSDSASESDYTAQGMNDQLTPSDEKSMEEAFNNF